jgi:signal transduction histidine kinase
VDNLLLLARADAQQIQIRKEAVSLHEAVMEVFEQLGSIARRRGVSVNVEEIQEAVVEGDPLWLGQIVSNLLNNAIKYTPAGGRVTITLTIHPIARSQSSNQQTSNLNSQHPTLNALVSISDTGPGIPPEHLPHIFDRFYRVDSGRSRDAGGVGLGLNIAQWAAEAHGGRIEVSSHVGKGTTFTLWLPLMVSQPSVASAK